jgi:hypothetical protein
MICVEGVNQLPKNQGGPSFRKAYDDKKTQTETGTDSLRRLMISSPAMTDLHKDLIPLLCELKPQSAHCNAVVDLNGALASAIRKVSGDEPDMDAAPDQPLATTGTQARGFSQLQSAANLEIIAAAKTPCSNGGNRNT